MIDLRSYLFSSPQCPSIDILSNYLFPLSLRGHGYLTGMEMKYLSLLIVKKEPA